MSTADERFDAKWQVDPTTGCHLWTGAAGNGYGTFWADGKFVGAHVYAYRRKYGPIPDGLVLDHFVCDNRPCCNPDHVRPETRRENYLRSNPQTGRCKCGEAYDYVSPQGRHQHRACKKAAKARFDERRRAAA